MNKKNAGKWELRLGVWQVVAVVGVVTGCMTFAFSLGFFSGRKLGFDMAYTSSASSSAKMPISIEKDASENSGDAAEQAVSEVYAKLNDKGITKQEPSGESEAVPELGAIKEADAIPGSEESDIQASNVPAGPHEEKKHETGATNETIKEVGEVWDAKAPQVPAHEDAPPKAVEAPPADSSIKVLGTTEQKPVEKEVAKVFETKHEAGTNTLSESQKAAIEKSISEPPKEAQAKIEKAVKEEKPKAVEKTVEKAEVKIKELPKKELPAVEAKKDTKKESGATVARGPIPSGWFAQVAAPKKNEDAEQIAGKLRGSGFSVVIENAQVRGEDYFRILVGPEGNRKQAEVLLDQLKREKYLAGEPFIRMVK